MPVLAPVDLSYLVHMLRRPWCWLLVAMLALAACGNGGSDETSDGTAATEDTDTSSPSLDEGIGTRVCDLLGPDDVARLAGDAAEGVYDGFLAPLADVCRYEGALTLQLDYGPLMGEPADITTYVDTLPGTVAEAITVGGFEAFLDYTQADAELGTKAFVNQVLVQVGDWVLILNPDDLFDPFGAESAVLQELAGLAAGRV